MSEIVPAPRRPVTLEELGALNSEIAALVRAGLPLDDGLRRFASDSGEAMTRLTHRLATHLSQGRSLAEALLVEGHAVPPLYRSIVIAGTRSRRLPDALEALATFVRNVGELRRDIGLALIYPTVVVVIAYFLAIGFIEFLVPQYHDAFRNIGGNSARMIESLLRYSGALRNWYWAPPVVFVLALWWWSRADSSLLKASRTSSSSGLPWSSAMRWIPGLSRVTTTSRNAVFCDLLALLLENNVPLPEALRLAAATMGEGRLARASTSVADDLETGRSLGQALERSPQFPPLLLWMLQTGEQQGLLPQMIREAGTLYRNRAAGSAEWCRTILPIVLVAVIGGCVTMGYGCLVFYPLTQLMRGLNAG